MKDAIRHLDKRFKALRPLIHETRPVKGWLRAIRNALGMTTTQLARRLDVSQPRIMELEKSEVAGNVTLNTLEQAAAGLGCRLVYALVPEKPLAVIVSERTQRVAKKQSDAVQHSMRLENQGVTNKRLNRDMRARRAEELSRRPARIWDET